MEDWLKVKVKGDIQDIYDQQGSSGVLIFIQTIWTQIRDVIDERRELEQPSQETRPEVERSHDHPFRQESWEVLVGEQVIRSVTEQRGKWKV